MSTVRVDDGGVLASPGAPGRTVLELWRYLQLGALPPAVGLYDDKVRGWITDRNLAGGLATASQQLKFTTPRLASAEKAAGGALVVLRASSNGGATQTYSFVLRKREGVWRITYDSLLGGAVRTFVAAQKQAYTNSKVTTPSDKALAAGRAAESAFAQGALPTSTPARPGAKAKAKKRPVTPQAPAAAAAPQATATASPAAAR